MMSIESLRKAKNLTYKELAKICDLSPPTIINAERGHSMSTTTLHKIAKGLGVTIGDLFPAQYMPYTPSKMREAIVEVLKVGRELNPDIKNAFEDDAIIKRLSVIIDIVYNKHALNVPMGKDELTDTFKTFM